MEESIGSANHDRRWPLSRISHLQILYSPMRFAIRKPFWWSSRMGRGCECGCGCGRQYQSIIGITVRDTKEGNVSISEDTIHNGRVPRIQHEAHLPRLLGHCIYTSLEDP